MSRSLAPLIDQVFVDVLRVDPVQQRSAYRIDSILDAAAALIQDRGMDELTTTLVAHGCGSSIGAVYRYFPDKQALLRGLAARNMRRYFERVAADRLADLTDWEAAVDMSLDHYVDMMRSEPGFRHVRFGDHLGVRLVGEGNGQGAMLAGMFAELLAGHYGIPATAEMLFAQEVSIEIGEALIARAFRTDPRGDERFITQARRYAKAAIAELLAPGAERSGPAIAD